MTTSNAVASTSTQNIVPVQAEFNTAGQCLGLVGPAGQFFSPPLTGNFINPMTFALGNNLVATAAALPTIGSGFGTNAVISGASTMAFKVVVGTGGASAGTINFPAAPNGWVMYASDVTQGSSIFLQQTGSTTTSATVASYGITTGTSSPMLAGDVILFLAIAF